MTKEELKKKICKTINKWAGRAVLENQYDGASVYNIYNAEQLADALIEAGIGDVAEPADKWCEMLNAQAEKTLEAENRKEVAERALKLACKTIAPSYVDTAKLYFEIFVNQAEKELAEERKDEQD